MNRDTFFWYLVLVIFILAIIKYYWKIQLMYGSSNYSIFTPDTFGIVNGDSYNKLCIEGFQTMKKTPKSEGDR